MEQPKKINYFLPLLFALTLIVGIQLGFKLRESTWNKKNITANNAFTKLDEIMNLVNVKYIDTVDSRQIFEKALDKFLVDLDPHSFYIPQSDLKDIKSSLEGNFEGIGIEFFLVKDTIVVVTPISGGPSERAGILSGDKIVLINDSIVAGKDITNNDVIRLLRGEKGTKVTLGILRNKSASVLDFTIVRDKIPLNSVDVGYMIDEETGYIKINRFAENTYKEFRTQLTKLKSQNLQKLIIDLRQNPGGYLNAATLIADELIDDEKLLVYTEGKAYKKNEYRAKNFGQFETGNLVIIIDEGSASASEILAGAVQDWDRGLIVGRRSFGKGLVQEQYELSDGSALRLTVARYFTPSGRSIQKPYNHGIEEYDAEIETRFNDGELLDNKFLEKSDTTHKYYTAGNRLVYGGGGIGPDLFIPIDTSFNVRYFLLLRSFVPEFIYNYYANNQELFISFKESAYFKQNFEVSEMLYQKFLDFAYSQNLPKNETESKLLAPRMKVILKAYLAKQIWKDDGFYPVINTIDNTFLKAYEVVQDVAQYMPIQKKKESEEQTIQTQSDSAL